MEPSLDEMPIRFIVLFISVAVSAAVCLIWNARRNATRSIDNTGFLFFLVLVASAGVAVIQPRSLILFENVLELRRTLKKVEVATDRAEKVSQDLNQTVVMAQAANMAQVWSDASHGQLGPDAEQYKRDIPRAFRSLFGSEYNEKIKDLIDKGLLHAPGGKKYVLQYFGVQR